MDCSYLNALHMLGTEIWISTLTMIYEGGTSNECMTGLRGAVAFNVSL